MKIIKILIGLLMIANLAMAEANVEVHINYPADSVFIGSYNTLEIWIENTDSVLGMSMGFKFSGAITTINWDMNYGIVAPVNIENDARGAIQWIRNTYGFGDTSLPDSLLVGGFYLPTTYTSLVPGSSRECVSLYFYLPESQSPGQFCVDNVYIPPTGTWEFGYSYGNSSPLYHGCQGTSSTNPDCPAICFPVAITTHLCGDVNGDLHINLVDMVTIINYIIVPDTPHFQYVFADVDCDGRVNIADAEFIMEYLFTAGPPPCSNCP